MANAVLDGTDAVMLSAETAVGDYPVETIEAMERICLSAENETEDSALDRRLDHSKFARVDQSIAMSALYAASHFKVKAIVALTQSGSTALWMSRINGSTPIYAMTPVEATLSKVTLFSGVHPIAFKIESKDYSVTVAPGGRRTASSGSGGRWRSDRDDRRRSHRQSRPHQHHEDRARGRPPQEVKQD